MRHPRYPARCRGRAADLRLLHGDYTSDDVVALGPILRLPTGYLRNADTTVTVDRQVTLLLLEKAARVWGVGDFRICRRTVEIASSDAKLAMLIPKIEDYRIILNPGLFDSLAEHGARTKASAWTRERCRSPG